MLTCARSRLSSYIFRKVSKEHIDWPKFGCSKICKVCRVRPEHNCCHDFLKFAAGIIGGSATLDFVMFFDKDIRVIEFGEDSLWLAGDRGCAELLEGRVMEMESN